jgi:hypothetical protein
MKKIFDRSESLKDGQCHLKVETIRSVKTKKYTALVSATKPTSEAVSTAFWNKIVPIIETRDYKEKVIGIHTENFRWMKPDGNGGLIPR